MVYFNKENFLQLVELQKLHKLNNSDSQSDVSIYSYNHCDDNDDILLKYCRSVIYDNSKNEVLSITFPYTRDLSNNDVLDFDDNWVFTNSYEGSLVQLYFNNDNWNLSTLKKLDAYSSRWGTKETFGELFTNAMQDKYSSLDDFYSLLDKELTYTFLLLSNMSSRFVCLPTSTKIVYTGSFDKTGHYCYSNVIPNIESVHYESLTNTELLTRVSSTDINMYQGLFGYNLQSGEFVKIFNTNYLNAKLLRGNEQDLRKRYLQTMKDPELHRRFRTHFFDHQKLFRRLDGSVHSFVRDIINNTMQPEYDEYFIDNGKYTGPKSHKYVYNFICNLHVDIIWKSVIGRLQRNRLLFAKVE